MESPLETSGIVPEIIDSVPSKRISVIYEDNIEVLMGNELTPTQVKHLPNITYEFEEGSLYTLLMTDPDAPSRQDPFYGECKHWLVINVPGCNVEKGQTVVEYQGAGAPKNTGLHRYIFLVFKQKEAISSDVFIDSCTLKGRLKTKSRDLMKEYNLYEPFAANFFEAQYDEYCEVLRKRYVFENDEIDFSLTT